MASIRVTTVSQFVALISHLLGFTPSTSIVAVSTTSGLHARVDFPTTVEDMTEVGQSLDRAYRNAPGDVHLFAFVDEPAHVTAAANVLATVAAEFQTNRVAAMFSVTGDRWSDLTPGEPIEHGTITTADRDLVAAQYVATGRPMPVADRATHVDRFTRDASTTVPVEVVGQVVEEMGAETTDEHNTVASATIDTARATGLALSDSEVARMLILSSVPGWRARLIETMNRGTGTADLTMWTQAAVQAPEGMDRTGALHLAAFAAWMAGDGATAWAALDTAHVEGAHVDVVAAVVIEALRNGTNPGTWQPGPPAGE